jgi:hypothetical protein
MEVNIVRKVEFSEGAPFTRLDAEYVWKSVWDVENEIRSRPGWHLDDLFVSYDGPTLNDNHLDDDVLVDYIDIDSVDTSDGLAYVDNIFFRDRPSRAKYVTKAGDLLVSNVRPNRGACTLVTEQRSGAMASSGFSLLRDKKLKEVPQHYLFAFLKSSFGKLQLTRRSRGSMYPAVTINDLRKVWVPKPPQEVMIAVCEAVKRGFELQAQFFDLLVKQETILRKFLTPFGHPPSPLEGDLSKANWTNVSSTHFREAGRFDAEFYRHEYQAFDAHLKSASPSFLLGEYYKLAAGRGLGSGEEIVPFIKQAVLTNAGINWSAVSFEQGVGRTGGNVHAGDILLACTAHEVYYVGRKVDYVREVPEEIRMSNTAVPDLMVFRPRPEKPKGLHGSYIAAFLRTPAGLHQVQRCIRGLRSGHVYKDDISGYVRVPLPEQAWLDDFEQRACAYESIRAQAKIEIKNACNIVEGWLSSPSVLKMLIGHFSHL